MAMPSSIQLRAVLLIVLLAGGEGARIAAGAGTLEAVSIAHADAATHGAFFQLGAASPVCGKKMDMTDPAAAVARYEAKRSKVTALSAEVREKNCVAQCPLMLHSIKTRLAEFESCNRALSDVGSMPAELRSVLASHQSNSLQATLMQVSTDLVILMKNKHLFPPQGGCEFNPRDFDLDEARGFDGNMDELRRRFFGNDCGSEASVKTYTESLSPKEAKAVTAFMEKVSKMMQMLITQPADEAEASIEKEIANLEANTDDAVSSLLALDSDGDLDAIGMIIGIVLGLLFLLFILASATKKVERLEYR